MINRLRPAIVTLIALILVCSAGLHAAPEGFVSWGQYFDTGSAASKPPSNVIIFIGDGMGSAHLEAGRAAAVAAGKVLAIDSVAVKSRVSTLSYDDNITDSAAAATAMATGHKAINRFLGIDSELRPVRTILEAVRDRGGRTALVTNCAITAATPAAFAVHVDDRGAGRDIARALVATRPDIMLGGGYMHFAPTLFEREQPAIKLAELAGYNVVRTVEGLKAASALPLLGLFADSDLQFGVDRDSAVEPSLAQMTSKAIELVTSGGEGGFFLMVENDLIDVASHDNDSTRMVAEVLAFDEAVSVGLSFARSNGDTLIIVVADHETGAVELSADGRVEFDSDGHSATHVPLFAEGPGQDRFAVELLHNTEIATIVAEVAGVTVGEPIAAGPESRPAEQASAAPIRPQLEGYGPRSITVMTYNIHVGMGIDFVYDIDRIAQLIADEGADIVGLNEVDYMTTRSRGQNQAKHIADKLGFYYAEGKILATSGGHYGNAVISRYPIVSSNNHFLPNPNGNEPRAALECQVDVDGDTLNFFVTHLDVRDAGSRTAQAIALVEMASARQGPTVITGDFNAVPLLSTETAAVMRQFNDTMQVYRMLVNSDELIKDNQFNRDYLKGGNTIDAIKPNRRIDYVFASYDLTVAGKVGAARVVSTLASDHLPYVVELQMPWQDRMLTEQPLVAVLSSPTTQQWLADMGREDSCDVDEIFDVVSQMGYECTEVSPEAAWQLPYAAAARPTVLLIPNQRRIDYRTAQAVREFVHAGGRVFATAQSSLKTPDELQGGAFGFGLADVFGVDLAGWLGVTPLHDAISPSCAVGTPAEEVWGGIASPLVLERREGMIVRSRPRAVTLGVWTDQTGVATHPAAVNSALVLNGRAIYCAADLLDYDSLQSEPVKALVASIVRFLLNME